MKVFLSYSSKDKKVAEEIYFAILGSGYEVFFDENSLPSGGDFHSRIRRGIEESDAYIFLISPNSVKDGSYVLTELKLAKEKWPSPKEVVLPVIIAPTERHLIDNYLNAVTYLEPKGSIAAEVIHALEKIKPKPQPYVNAVELSLTRREKSISIWASNVGSHIIRDIEINTIPDDINWYEQTHGPLPKLKILDTSAVEVTYPILGGWFYAVINQLSPNRGLMIAEFEIYDDDYTIIDCDVFWNDHTGMQRKSHGVADLRLANYKIQLEPRL